MRTYRVGAICLLGILSVLGGCQSSVQEEKLKAHSRWDIARARVLAGGAEEALEIGKLDKAQAQAEQAMSLAPNLPKAHTVLGRIHIERGRYSSAIIELEKALEQAPRSDQAAYLLGAAYEKSGNLAEALEAYRKAGRLNPGNFHAVIAQAEVLAGMGKLSEALSLLEGRLDQAGDDPTAFELCGRISMILGNYVKAENYYRTASVLDDGNLLYRKALGQAHYARGHYREAIAAMTEIAEHPEYDANYTVYAILGECYLALGRGPAAREAFFTASELGPSEPKVWMGLAKAYLATGEGPRAILAARQAIRLAPTDPDAVLLGGYAMIQADRNAEAAEMLSFAIRRHPRNAMIRCMYGRALAASGSRTEARRAYQAALRLDPDLKLARALLADLDEDLSRAD